MKWKVTQKSKTVTTYIDTYEHGWPTVIIGGVETSDGTEKTTEWNYNTSSKSVSVSMPTISRPWVNTYSGGTVSISKASDASVSYKGGSITINLDPNITFRQGFISGVSERTWTISNTINKATNQEYWTLNKFNDIVIKLPAIAASNKVFGDATLSWRDTGTQSLSFSKSSKTWNNSNSDDSFTATLAPNLPTIGSWSASASDGTLRFTSTTRNSGSTSSTISFSGTTYQDGVLTPSPSTITISQNGTNISGAINIKAEGTGVKTCTSSVTYPIDGNTTSGSFTLNDALQRYVTGAGTLTADIYGPSGNISVNGESIYVSSSGSPSTDSEASKTQSWSISATSNIVSTNPSGGNPIISGTIKPLSPGYHYEYKLNSGSWQRSTSFSIGSNIGSVTANSSATLTATTYTDVKDGIYRYERGHYHRNSTSAIPHKVTIRVVDDHDSKKNYEGGSDSKNQSGDSGEDYYKGGSWIITPANDYNCTVSTMRINYTGSEYVSSESGIGAFDVTPDWYASNTSYPDGNNSVDGPGYVSDYSNTISRGSVDNATPNSELFGADKTFQLNETISQNYGVKSSSPDIITTTTSTSGSITWKYKYLYSVISDDSYDPWHFTKHEADGRYDPPADTVNTKYYRCVNNNGNGWVRLSESTKTFTATSTGTYTVEIAWMRTDSNGNYITDEYKGYSKHKITVGQITRIYRLLVGIIGGSDKTAFDTTDWTLTTVVTAQYKDGSGSWTNTTTPSGISYAWSGASGSGSTATVGVSSVPMGSDGSHIGKKNVSVTVSLSGYTSGNATVTLGRYGKSYYNA